MNLLKEYNSMAFSALTTTTSVEFQKVFIAPPPKRDNPVRSQSFAMAPRLAPGNYQSASRLHGFTNSGYFI